ncbi:MAG: ABC transporter permease [Chloroflexota bacterium]|nr:ABC transporter permease [Chloroflexota bacterium]
MNDKSLAERLTAFAFILLPIAASLGLTALLVIAVGSDPREVFDKLMEGAFRNGTAFAGVVNFWIPLALCSIGLVVTFRAGLWNIGVEGQMMMGAVFASWAAQFVALPSPLLIPLEIALAMLGGVLWAGLVGVLKTRLGVHEIFGGVALNALANVATIYLISGPWAPSDGSAQATAPFPDGAILPPLSADFPVSGVGLGVALIAVVVLSLALSGTRWGLQLKATGKNARSALLLGVPTTRSYLTAFMVCGAVAGAAGAYRALFTYTSLRPLISGGIGFLALLVVLLVGIRAVWTPLIAFAFAVILGGSTRVKVALRLDQSLAGVLQGIVVLFVMLSNGLRTRWQDRRAASDAPTPTVTPSTTVEMMRSKGDGT